MHRAKACGHLAIVTAILVTLVSMNRLHIHATVILENARRPPRVPCGMVSEGQPYLCSRRDKTCAVANNKGSLLRGCEKSLWDLSTTWCPYLKDLASFGDSSSITTHSERL